jgi:hypothetical protein
VIVECDDGRRTVDRRRRKRRRRRSARCRQKVRTPGGDVGKVS